ncbi:MAG TPA: malic enzyme-like NAD(P)-binding protein [Byssovorax sp.]|jgi:malate dehydrogenase (oxaloacetate-decarboxylating)
MRKATIDTTLRIRLKHKPGQMLRVAEAVAANAALLGDITTVRNGEDDTIRDVTVETQSDEHTASVLAAVRALENIEVLSTTDRVFDVHKGGKLHASRRVRVENVTDLRYVYTPGVARVSRALQRDPELAWDLTGIGNSVGIFTNGTRVLGLGDIGVVASMPVMEGKAVLYDAFVGISATPILLAEKDPKAFVETVVRVAPTFGGVHLEDIRVPDCFAIEDELVRRLERPVMHDDQHGTATVALAALINACKITGVDLARARIGQIGLGAAGSAIALLAMAFGAADVIVHDPSEPARKRLVDRGARAADLETLMKDADIVIAATGRPGLIPAKLVRPGQVIFALSNPEAEIEPSDALAAGAAFASDGRSINNALAFPGLFRGALDAKSRAITEGMRIAAARAIAAHAEPGEVVPSPLAPEVHRAVRAAVAEEARRSGLANTARLAP